MEEFLSQENIDLIWSICFFLFIIMIAVGINNTIEVLKLRHEFSKVNFENQFEVQRFTISLINSKIPSTSIKLMLLRALKQDCEGQNYEHLVSKIQNAIDEITKKG